jgi:hypothetical protein
MSPVGPNAKFSNVGFPPLLVVERTFVRQAELDALDPKQTSKRVRSNVLPMMAKSSDYRTFIAYQALRRPEGTARIGPCAGLS